jgi:predicted ATP-grasp superfamily ATP-dependent carboligase
MRLQRKVEPYCVNAVDVLQRRSAVNSHLMDSRVLVTNAHSRAGLSVIRSLGRKGIRVTAADHDRVALGFFSRYCERRLHYPDPVRFPEEYRRAMLDELAIRPYDVVMPLLDDCLLALAPLKHAMAALTRFPYLGYDQLMQGRDKAITVENARRCGLRTPATFPVHSALEVEHALAQCALPVIVRPRQSQASNGLCRVGNHDQVWITCERVAREFGPVIIQEYVPWGGFTYDVDVLMNRDSVARAVVVCKRLRTYPALGGPTSCGQAIHWPALAETAIKLLTEMRWYGPAEVEFRIDPRDGAPVFMEVNPRLWGSLYTSDVAGVDFPYLLYRLAMDGDVAAVTTYRTDMKARYFFTLDLLCMLTHPRKRSIAREWLMDFFDPKVRVFIPSWRDPVPLLGRLLGTLVYGLRPSRLRQRLNRIRVRNP